MAQLKEEEANRAQLRAERDHLAHENRPNVLPHRAVIQSFLQNLLHLLDADEARARALLRRFMPEVILVPLPAGGFKVTGGFDLEATVDTEKSRPLADLLRASRSRRDRLPEDARTYFSFEVVV